MRIVFIGINGYQLPYTRVRCYHFADALRNRYNIDTEVLSYQEHLSPQYDGIQMLNLDDKEKFRLTINALLFLLKKKKSVFYIQKVHYHAAGAFLLSQLCGNKFFLDYDDWDIDRAPFFKKAYLNRIFFSAEGAEQITANVASKAAGCIASSRYLYGYLLRFNRNVSYIPTGVNTDYFVPQKRNNSDYIVTFVWTGQIWGELIYNNILYILFCFREVSRDYSNIRLRIIGGGAWLPKLREEIQNNFSYLNIEIIDWVNPVDIVSYLADADIGLLPLIFDDKNELWMKSKSPTKLFEYMAMGLPTVASNVGEVRYIIDNNQNGLLVDDKKEFIEKMKLLVKNMPLRIKMGESAREKVTQEFSLQVLTKRLFDFLSVSL